MSSIYFYPTSEDTSVIELAINNSSISKILEYIQKQNLSVKLSFEESLDTSEKLELDALMRNFPLIGSIPIGHAKNYYSESLDEVHSTARTSKIEKLYENMPNGRYLVLIKFKWNYSKTNEMFYYELVVNNNSLGSSNIEPKDDNNYRTEMDFAFINVVNNTISISLDFWSGSTRGVAKMKDAKILVVRE